MHNNEHKKTHESSWTFNIVNTHLSINYSISPMFFSHFFNTILCHFSQFNGFNFLFISFACFLLGFLFACVSSWIINSQSFALFLDLVLLFIGWSNGRYNTIPNMEKRFHWLIIIIIQIWIIFYSFENSENWIIYRQFQETNEKKNRLFTVRRANQPEEWLIIQLLFPELLRVSEILCNCIIWQVFENLLKDKKRK